MSRTPHRRVILDMDSSESPVHGEQEGVFLSFAGYRRANDLVHRAIAALSPGDLLDVRVRSHRWELLDRDGTVVGQLAGSFNFLRRLAPDGMRCTFATVLAIATWDSERSEPEYRDRLQCDNWEVYLVWSL